MEIWKSWGDLKKDVSNFSLEVANDSQALNIMLKNKNEEVKFKFLGGWFSYKITTKKAFLRMLDFLKQKKRVAIPKGCFFYIVENSDFLDWQKEESLGVYEHANIKIKHFVFIGSNAVFEILTTETPEINIKNIS